MMKRTICAVFAVLSLLGTLPAFYGTATRTSTITFTLRDLPEDAKQRERVVSILETRLARLGVEAVQVTITDSRVHFTLPASSLDRLGTVCWALESSGRVSVAVAADSDAKRSVARMLRPLDGSTDPARAIAVDPNGLWDLTCSVDESLDEFGGRSLLLEFDPTTAERLHRFTGDHVFETVVIALDDRVAMEASVRSALGSKMRITGPEVATWSDAAQIFLDTPLPAGVTPRLASIDSL
ncbi:MAG: hypothetical protein KDC38_01780 [Planctomycetes bacterium]|nr:hypothetical protein [Planctomycetota bacterium]